MWRVRQQNYIYHVSLFISGGSCSLRQRQWKISRRSRLVSWNEKQINCCEKQRALCLRGTRGSKIRNRPRNQIFRRDNDDARQRGRRHLSDRLIVDGILDYCECDGGRFFTAWRTSGSVIAISQPFNVFFNYAFRSTSQSNKSLDIYKYFNERCIH